MEYCTYKVMTRVGSALDNTVTGSYKATGAIPDADKHMLGYIHTDKS